MADTEEERWEEGGEGSAAIPGASGSQLEDPLPEDQKLPASKLRCSHAVECPASPGAEEAATGDLCCTASPMEQQKAQASSLHISGKAWP